MKFVHIISKFILNHRSLMAGMLWLSIMPMLMAEGTRQVAPSASDAPVMLETNNPLFGSFAAYNSLPQSRLYFTIGNLNEKVFLGLALEYTDDGVPFAGSFSGQYSFRIRYDNGSDNPIVHGPFVVNNTNANVTGWADALFGAYPVTATQSGQLMFQFQPTALGNYFIEITDGAAFDGNAKVNIPFWDITVANNNVPINGRVWSRNWAFRTPRISPEALPDCEWNRTFNGALYSYTTDGFVSRIDFENAGMQGLSFNVTFNNKGPGISGNLTEDRKSIPDANATVNSAEHQVFLSEPDINLFPSGLCGELDTPATFTCLSQDSYCLEVSVTKPGQVEVILDFNQNGILDADSEDVNLVYEFTNSNLAACIPWDGLRGDGTPIEPGDTIDIIFFYSQGIQHWSAYDVEYMRNGFCVETIRPICEPNFSSNLLYWDDRNIVDDPGTGATKDGRNGCECEDNCRNWDNFDINSDSCTNFNDDNTTGYGDKNTLNTWWFANTSTFTRLNIPLVDAVLEGPDQICEGETATFTAVSSSGNGQVTFAWTGPNGFTASTASIQITQAGEYCVSIEDVLGCSANLCKTLTVTNADDGSITYPTTLSACLGSSVTLQHSGDVAGYTFSWSPTTGLSDSTIPNPSFTFSGAIDYVVTITDPITGCSFNRSVSVTGLLEPTPSFTVSSGCSQGLTMNFISTSTNAATYSWDFGVAGTNTDVSNLANPTYTFPAYSEYMVSLTVTSADGCSETFTTPVTVSNIPLQADFDINYGDCGDNSVMVQFTNTTINGANNTTAYSWAFSNGTPNSTLENPVITVTSSQTITALLTVITADGCVSTASQTFDVVLGPPADQFPATITVCQGVPSQITPGGNPAYSYLWSPGTGINDILSPQPIFSPTTTTLYTVTITSIGVDTCEVVETVEVVVPPSINLQIDGGGNYCTPTATLTATADVPVTFNWYNANGSQVATGPSYTPSVSGISTFTVEAIDASGCSETQNVTISGGPVNIAVPDTVAICLGEEVNLFVTNLDTNDELTYLWEPANLFATGTTTSPTPDFLEAIGTYEVSVTVTNQFGCSTQENIHVAVLGPNLTLSFESLIDCNGGTVVFTNTSSNAFGYVWNFGDGSPLNFDESPIHTYAEAGLYTVTLGLVYDVSCATTFSMDIMVEAPQIFADFTYDITECGAETAVIQFMDTSTNSLDNTIAWEWTFEGATPTSSMEQNPSVTVNGENPVTATLTIFTANDCQNSHTETLTVDLVDLDIAMTDTLVVCLGESVTLNEGGDGSLSYAWSPVATLDDPSAVSPVATPSETTTYYVTAFSTVGSDTCFVTDSVVVFVPTEIELELDQMPVVITCGEDVVITATANVDVTVNWFSTTDGAIGTGAAVTVNPFRQDTIIAIATDIFGCTATDTIIIIDNGVDISVMGGNEQEVCRGVPATLTVENLDTEDELTYEWMPMEFIIGSNTGASVQVLVETEGTFTFTAMVTNQHDCIDTVEVSVTVSEFDGQVEDMVFVCAGEPTAINPDGIPTLVYEWTPVDDFIDLSNPWNPVVTTSEPLTYMVNVTDPVLGCTFMDTVQILIHPAVNPVIAPQNVVICDGSDITLTATGDAPIATVTWYLADDNSVLGTGNPFTFSSPLGSHEIIAETVSENGCTERDTVVIHNQPLDVTITNELIICEPIASTELEVINNDPNQTLTVNWAPEGVLTALDQLVVTVDPNVTGSFSVAVSNQFGCTDTLATTVTVIDLIGTLAIDAAPDTILLGESTTITVSGCTGCDYIWDITTENSSVIVYSPDETGEQFAFVNVNLLGCEADLSTSFFVIDATCDADHIFFPNAFTPNNDGDNDELRVRSNFSEELTEMELLIYNRWGEEMFRTTNIYDAWDGTHRGEALPPDVYGYYLRVLCPNGDELIQKGNVTLLR